MDSINLNLNLPTQPLKSYPIIVGIGLLKKIAELLKTLKPASKYIIITDSNVKKLYSQTVFKHLKENGFKVELLSFPAGEKNKNELIKMKLDHTLLKKKCDRQSLIIALGGGVVGDLAGFVAATYMRGIRYVHIPTTLLSQVDSSIGGKVGIDTPFGKNLVGAFWHPEMVVSDLDCLKSLSEVQMINGLLEVFKIFLTCDQQDFDDLQRNLPLLLKKNAEVLKKTIARAVELKIELVTKDEREQGERAILNFGHTIGHALEHLSKYKLLHGYAIGEGILLESRIAVQRGILSAEDFNLIEKSLQKFGINKEIFQKFPVKAIIQSSLLDKKSVQGGISLILLESIGKIYQPNKKSIHLILQNEIIKVYNYYIKKE